MEGEHTREKWGASVFPAAHEPAALASLYSSHAHSGSGMQIEDILVDTTPWWEASTKEGDRRGRRAPSAALLERATSAKAVTTSATENRVSARPSQGRTVGARKTRGKQARLALAAARRRCPPRGAGSASPSRSRCTAFSRVVSSGKFAIVATTRRTSGLRMRQTAR